MAANLIEEGNTRVKITGKAKFAQISGLILNGMFFGDTVASGDTIPVLAENHAIPGSSAYTIAA